MDGLPVGGSQALLLDQCGIRPDLLIVVDPPLDTSPSHSFSDGDTGGAGDSLSRGGRTGGHAVPSNIATRGADTVARPTMERARLARHIVTVSELRSVYGDKGVLIATIEGTIEGTMEASGEGPPPPAGLSRLSRALSRPGVRVMVAGMAGSGKGAVCEYISHAYGLEYISMSTVVHGARGTDLGRF